MTAKKIRQFTIISLIFASITLFLLSFGILMKGALSKETKNFINKTTQYYSDLFYSQIKNDLRRTKNFAEYLDELDNYGISPEDAVRKMKDDKYSGGFLLAGFIRPTEKGCFVYKDCIGDFEIHENQRVLFSKLMKSGNSVFMARLPGNSEYIADDLKNVSVFLYSSPCYYPNGLLKGVAFFVSSIDLYYQELLPSRNEEINVFFILDKNNVMIPSEIEREYGSVSKIEEMLIRGNARNKKAFEELNANITAYNDGEVALFFEKKKFHCVYRLLRDTQCFIGLIINDNAVTRDGANLPRIEQKILFAIGIFAIVLLILLIMSNHSEKEDLRLLAYHDTVTGHRNFSGFTQDFHNLLAKDKDAHYALITFDIDKFKNFNEHHGYKAGNHLLSYISNTLKHALHDNEIFSRLNGDYFVILMHYQNEAELLLRLKEIRDDIVAYKNKPDYHCDIMVRMGICRIDKETINVIVNEKSQSKNFVSCINQLINKAVVARQSIKNMPLSIFYSFYQESMADTISHGKTIESDMQTAPSHQDFTFYLHPKYSLKTKSIIGAEVLMRGTNPDAGFVPLFERSGFAAETDFCIFEHVCQTVRMWIDENYPVVPISLNFSHRDLQHKETISKISDIADRYKIPIHLVEFELTESIICEKTVFLADFEQKLCKNRFSISIDDFGSDCSSFNMLKDTAADTLKLDKTFAESETREHGNKVISKVIELSKSLHIENVSEDAEAEKQTDFLAKTDSDTIQGYYFACPMSVSEFEETYLKNQSVNNSEET